MSASQREGLPFVRSTKFGVVRTKYGVVRPKRNDCERKGTRHFGIQPMHAHRAAISGPHSQSRCNRRQSVGLTRNPDAIGGNQWPSHAIPMQSVAPLTHRCSTKGIEPQLSMPPTPACDRAVSSTCRSGGYDLGTVIRGNQAPYSSTVLRGNQWQSSAVLKHCAQGQSGAIKRRTQALCSGAISGNQWQSRPHHTCAPSTLTHVRSRSTRSAAWRVRGRRLSGKLSRSSEMK